MKIAGYRWARVSASLTGFVIFAVLAAAAQDATPPPELPDSPGAVATEQKTSGESASGQPASPQAESTTRKPVGSAAAEKPETTGVAASNAAGVAIAPGRQKHTRSLIIKMGAILGAGVALGTVAALSSASPNRPPGSH